MPLSCTLPCWSWLRWKQVRASPRACCREITWGAESVQVVIRGDPLFGGSFHPLSAPDSEELADLFWLALAMLG